MGKHSRKNKAPNPQKRVLSARARFFANEPGTVSIVGDRAYIINPDGQRIRVELPDELKGRIGADGKIEGINEGDKLGIARLHDEAGPDS